jgi:hypothetical protein
MGLVLIRLINMKKARSPFAEEELLHKANLDQRSSPFEDD